MKSAFVAMSMACACILGIGSTPAAAGLCNNGDCSALLVAANGTTMDGAVNLDSPTSAGGGQGVQMMCTATEGQPQPSPWKDRHWQLRGPGIVVGQPYRVDLRVWGVVECKTYPTSGARAPYAGNAATYDLWLPSCRDNGDHWNTDAFTVSPQASSVVPGMGGFGPPPAQTYCLNQCPAGVGESYRTWKIDSVHSIAVPGGSYINFVEFDTNCRGVLNCGVSSDSSTLCSDHYAMSIPGTVNPPAGPSVLMQPAAQGVGAGSFGFGQWWYVDVVDVTPQ